MKRMATVGVFGVLMFRLQREQRRHEDARRQSSQFRRYQIAIAQAGMHPGYDYERGELYEPDRLFLETGG
jgi:hypothetical protein